MITDSFRSNYHFTPPANWLNDPNGLVYYQGEYHLFYQHYPGGYGAGVGYADPLKWGPTHWGHAVSKDLLHWKHLPIAIYPDSAPGEEPIRGMVFSGSAVIDRHNTSGLRSGNEDLMVACFTQTDTPEFINQRQCIAYSNDRGSTWTKYSGNPVIPNPGLHDYRDPKIFWHGATGRWIMIVSTDDRLALNVSSDLKHWIHASDFGPGYRPPGDPAWECPDLFELPVDDNPEQRRWVLLVSVQRQGPHGGSGMRYFLGHFDGTAFHPDLSSEITPWLDRGRDLYAGITWSDHPDNHKQRLFIGWMSNLDYAQSIPAKTFRGTLTLPRKLTLHRFPEGIRLVSAPIEGLATLRREPPLLRLENEMVDKNRPLAPGVSLEIVAGFRIHESTATEFGFALRKGQEVQTLVGYNAATKRMFVDRTCSGGFVFNDNTGPHIAPLSSDDGVIKMHIFLDRTSVEVFGNGGHQVITDLIFPPPEAVDTELYVSHGNLALDYLVIHELNHIRAGKYY